MPRRIPFMLLGIALAVVFALTASVDMAHAQSGHFVGDVTCRDAGLQLVCSGKAAGLGGTTFEITVTADGIASVECTNPGGNVAPGQSFSFEAEGTTGSLPTPRNGQFRFSVPTDAPTAPAGSCPNAQWTPDVVDVTFTEATVTLSENGAVSDTITVPVD